jgi:hypothetical protein
MSDYCIVETSRGTARSGGDASRRDPDFNLFFAGLRTNVAFTQATIYVDPAFNASGFNLDNLYWVPDEGGCDPCDMICDGAINAFDIEPFLDLLFGPNPTPCCANTGDVNCDGVVNAFDIEPFLNCLFP